MSGLGCSRVVDVEPLFSGKMVASTHFLMRRRRIHACHMRKMVASTHFLMRRRRIHACHMRKMVASTHFWTGLPAPFCARGS
jgi:hypothetical protein